MSRRKKALGASEEDLRAIDDFLKKEGDLLRRKDINGIPALYTEDAIFLPPNEDIIQGREAIKNSREQLFSVFDELELKATALEVVGMSDAVALRYTYVFKGQRKGQKATERKGRGVALFKRTPEGLELKWDIWNNPPPPK